MARSKARSRGPASAAAGSRKLAELLGGNVSVRSELERGSTFCVVIPRVLRESAEVTDETAMTAPLNPA